MAVKKNNGSIIKVLLNIGADINIQNEEGNTPLILAVKKSKVYIIKILLNSGVDPNIQNEEGETALMFACRKSVKMTEILLKYGADVNIQNKIGMTALMLIIQNPNKFTHDIIQLFLKYNVDVNIQDSCDWTALMHAVMNDNVSKKMIKILLDNNADINAQNCDGDSALIFSGRLALYDSIKAMKILLNYNPDIDQVNMWGGNVITEAFELLGKDNTIINMLLPNRKKFVEKVIINSSKILKPPYKRFKYFDFKITNISINDFRKIIKFF